MLHKLLFSTAVIAMTLSAPAIAGNYGEKSYDKSAHAEAKMEMNLVDIATSKDDFSTLVTALQAADLVDTIKNSENITIFAPTNDAFAKLPAGTVEELLKPENKEQLQGILTKHVLGTEVMSGDIAQGVSTVQTLSGESVTITKGDDGVSVNGASVIKADIDGSNGVIHVIDEVIAN
jgi:uncharacterized surface protein with fasciclin (FAS1) repeats